MVIHLGEDAGHLLLELGVFSLVLGQSFMEASSAFLPFGLLLLQRLHHAFVVFLQTLFHLGHVVVQVIQLRVQLADLCNEVVD